MGFKLTEKEVDEIAELYSTTNVTMKELQGTYNCGSGTIYKALTLRGISNRTEPRKKYKNRATRKRETVTVVASPTEKAPEVTTPTPTGISTPATNPTEIKMICPTCGREVTKSDEMKYCCYCGTELLTLPEIKSRIRDKMDEIINHYSSLERTVRDRYIKQANDILALVDRIS